MCKRMLVCITILLLVSATSFAVGVGIFDDTKNIGYPYPVGPETGRTEDLGGGAYNVTGGGGDVWDDWDQFHYAYKSLAGSWRISTDFQWTSVADWWSKGGVMVRASDAQNAVNYQTLIPATPWGHNETIVQGRDATGNGTWGGGTGTVTTPAHLGVQRFDMGIAGISLVENIADFGSGWQLLNATWTTNMPQTAMYGVFVTSHAQWRWNLASATVSNVAYEQNPKMFTTIPTVDNPDGTCPQVPGFKIRSIKVGMGLAWPGSPAGAGYAAMNQLLDSGQYPAGNPGEEEDTRIDQFVNLYDSGGRGEFFNDNGYPDKTFPGIDEFEVNPGDPANDDDDNNYATEVLACIQLTAGYHVIGANSDDGTIIWIGGVEIGRAGEWKGTSNADFLFSVATAGLYSLKARMLEGGGGSALELHEVLPDGTRILLGDTARGGSPVYVPEPATIALLGLGGLSLLGSRRKH